MLVRWAAPATEDLKRITLYIRKDSASAARHVAKTIVDAGNSLETLPKLGREGRIPGTRERGLPGMAYILVYQLTEHTVEILHIYHGAQDWP